ncbi:ABC transporter substrate-binding protein [Paenibacillus sp. MBLB4367]|uniref:ABC transporter substrate-binding protein n=1 Tax=Paenibacillus sp. MBLB4367 TaxID=3384767 RepID=UPI0039080B3F
MKRFNKSLNFAIAFAMIASLVAACSSGGGTENGGTSADSTGAAPAEGTKLEMTTEPITLKFMSALWSDESFKEFIQDEVTAKFPNITMELISEDEGLTQAGIEKSLSKGLVPDIIQAHTGYEIIKDFDMDYPLDDLIKANKYDLGKFQDGLIDIYKARDPYGKGKLYGIPYENVATALYYNKSIFDKFGVAYPKDGMTWDQVIELAKRVTGERDGVKYRGLMFESWWHYTFALSQLSANGTDPATGEPQFSKNPAFAKFFDLIKQMVSIPGNWEKGMKENFANQQAAMQLNHLSKLSEFNKKEGFNFDVVSFPVWPDVPNTAPTKFIGWTLGISKQSKYKQEAFKVIEFLTSPEVQERNARKGKASPLKDPNIMEHFAADKIGDKKYNVKGAISLKPPKAPVYSRFGPDIQMNGSDYVGKKANEFITSTDDVSTFLRKMDDDYATIVKEMQNKK